ncbi:MAG: calcium-binding protein, partial [Accumulibacter sp.]|uniref:beta strand repeat-containing protein n=1 Tax=Accumulibacter sp. TaxID=2053492 RepID=UPI0033150F14
MILGGAGSDTLDGGTGLDAISGGAGNDRVVFHGSEASLGGGTGSDTLVLAAAGGITSVDLAVTSGSDQTVGDTVAVTDFENVDASVLGAGQTITLTGSAAANRLTGGAGADTIHGGGGGDVVDAGAGTDAVDYWGTETSLEGGADADTLVLKSSAEVNLGTVDQTVGDGVTASGFENIDASGLDSSHGVRLTGSVGVNRIVGGSGADTLTSGGGADTLSGGAGGDTLHFAGSEASIDGGAGSDTLVLDAAGGITAIDLAVAAGSDQTTGDTVAVANVESVDASILTTGQAVTITGSSGANTVIAGAGSDTIHGGGGLDAIQAGGGEDRVDYWGAEASLDGGTGLDTLVLSTTTIVNLGNADQTTGDLTAVTSFENVDGSGLLAAQGVSITGSAAANTILGGAGADTIRGAGGSDAIAAGAGDDTVDYWGSEASIAGEGGVNTLTLQAAATVDLGAGDQTTGDSTTVTGFRDVDAAALSTGVSLTGSTAANRLTGGAGADTLDGGTGADTLAGGGGDDLALYRGTEAAIDGGAGSNTLRLTTAVAVNLGNSDQTSGDGTSVANFQNVDAAGLGAAQAVTITGSSGDNVILGGAGDDTIHGAGGADSIAGGGGDDAVDYWGSENTLDGGIGTNTLVMKAAATVQLANADQTSGDGVVVASFQNIDASGLSTGASLTGTAGVNTIVGGVGADTIDGGGGLDAIAAAGGDDTVLFRGTEASLSGGTGSDTLRLAAAGGITSVDLTVATGVDQTVGDTVSVTDFENVDASVLGAAQAITMTGSAAANRLTGGAGADTIHGSGGADVIVGGAGDDRIDYWGSETSLDGGADTNTLVMKAATTVDLAGADQTAGDLTAVAGFQNVDGSGLTTLQSLFVTGSVGDNVLTGGAGADTIDGFGGSDAIDGGLGDDRVTYRGSEASLTGGAGSDTLRLAAAGGITGVDLSVASGVDQTIGDTVTATDFESLDASVLTALQAITVTGSAGANTITGGAGADTIDGGSGADVIAGGQGDDRVSYHGTETSIGGGTGANTLVLGAVTTVELSNADQTTGDLTAVTGFQNIDASGLGTTEGVVVTGSGGINVLTGGAGADTIDGAGGSDTISGGVGNDRLAYRGSEAGIAGGTGINTLVLKTATTVDLAATTDQTSGDGTTVTGIAAVDASQLTTGVAVTGTTGADTVTGGAGADTIAGANGLDVLAGGGGADRVDYWGGEASIDGGSNSDTLVLRASGGITGVNLGVASGADQTSGDTVAVTDFENVDASILTALQAVAITGSADVNRLAGGAGNDTIHGAGGDDTLIGGDGADVIDLWGTEGTVDGGTGTDTLVLETAATVNLGNATDQTAGDLGTVTGFENVDASGL